MSNSSRSVFVLDVSYSMGGQKCETLQLSVKRIIEDIPEGDYVGVVLFNDRAEVAHRLVQITDTKVRESIKSSVPQMARGNTDIGSGLLKGLDVLRSEGISTIGSTIILVTDAEDNAGYYETLMAHRNDNYLDRVLPNLLVAKIKVICIAIGNNIDDRLETLARETNGNIYIASDTNSERAARVIESTIVDMKASTDMSGAPIFSVCNDIVAIDQNFSKNVVIDTEIGRNTEITISSEDINNFSISITSPNGHKYDSNSKELTNNLPLRRFQLKLENTEPGFWAINFAKNFNEKMSASVSVISRALNPNPIQMKVILKDPDVITQLPALIIAQIVKGTDAVIGAEVIATVEKPDGSETQIRLENHNSVYINYFTDYSGSGRYNVSVYAKNGATNHLQSLKSGLSSGKHFVTQFERQQIVGCFKVKDFMPKKQNFGYNLKELSFNIDLNNSDINSSPNDCNFNSLGPQYKKSCIRPQELRRDNMREN